MTHIGNLTHIMKRELYKILIKNIIIAVFWVTVVTGATMFGFRSYLPRFFAESYIAGVAVGVVNLLFIEQFV